MAAILLLTFSGISAWLLTGRLRTSSDRTIGALSGFVLWVALYLLPVHLLATLQLAGWVPRVEFAPLASFEAVVLAASLIWTSTTRSSPLRPASAHPAGNSGRIPAFVVISAIILAGTCLLFASRLLVCFPDDSDAIVYHIPLSVRWLQQRSLRMPDSHVWEFSLPGNAEIGMMLLLGAGAQRFLSLGNLLAGIVLALSTFLIAKRCSTNRAAILGATLIALSLPIVQFQVFGTYVDIFGTAFLLAAVALFLHRFDSELQTDGDKRLSWTRLALAALACGISVGTKHPYYLYGGVFVLSAGAVLIRERSIHKRLAASLLLLVLGTLAPCAFWMGRSWQATGNPVYPQPVVIAGHTLFSGDTTKITPEDFEENFVHSRLEWLSYPWTEWKKTTGYLLIPYSTGSGLGAAFAAFVPLGLVFAIRTLLAHANKSSTAFKVLIALWFPLLICWWFALRRMPRFGLPLWVLACIFAAPLLAFLYEGRFRRAFEALFVLALLSSCAISGFVPAHAVLASVRDRDFSRPKFYDYPKAIDNLPPGTRMVNEAGSSYNFVLAGSRLTNQVIPDFEVPPSLTPEYLHREHANVVVECLDASQQVPPPPSHGLEIMFEEVRKVGDTGRRDHWRIWRVE